MRRPRGNSGPIEVEAFRRDVTANVHLLLAAARAVLAGFRQEIDGGTLRPPQHASLLILETSLEPFAGVPGALESATATDETVERSSGPAINLPAPATGKRSAAA